MSLKAEHSKSEEWRARAGQRGQGCYADLHTGLGGSEELWIWSVGFEAPRGTWRKVNVILSYSVTLNVMSLRLGFRWEADPGRTSRCRMQSCSREAGSKAEEVLKNTQQQDAGGLSGSLESFRARRWRLRLGHALSGQIPRRLM